MTLRREFGLSYLFVAHDLAVVEHISHRIVVMYLGKIVEIADKTALFTRSQHPYTEALLSAAPVPDPEAASKRTILNGDVRSPIDPPSGCRFHNPLPQHVRALLEGSAGRCARVACHLREVQTTAFHKPGGSRVAASGIKATRSLPGGKYNGAATRPHGSLFLGRTTEGGSATGSRPAEC